MLKLLRDCSNQIRFCFYCFVQSFKGADFLSNNTVDPIVGHTIIAPIQVNNVWEALLFGQITEEVLQLRYSLYRVDKEANKYKYIGNGICVKRDYVKEIRQEKVIQDNYDDAYTFVEMYNMMQEQGVKNALQQKTPKVIKLKYDALPSCMYQDAILRILIDKENSCGTLMLAKKFCITDKIQFKKSVKKLNEFVSVFNNLQDEYKDKFMLKNDFTGRIKEIQVTTLKAVGEYDGTYYTLKGLSFDKYRDDDNMIFIDFHFNILYIDDEMPEYRNEIQEENYRLCKKKENATINFIDALNDFIHKSTYFLDKETKK